MFKKNTKENKQNSKEEKSKKKGIFSFGIGKKNDKKESIDVVKDNNHIVSNELESQFSMDEINEEEDRRIFYKYNKKNIGVLKKEVDITKDIIGNNIEKFQRNSISPDSLLQSAESISFESKNVFNKKDNQSNLNASNNKEIEVLQKKVDDVKNIVQSNAEKLQRRGSLLDNVRRASELLQSTLNLFLKSKEVNKKFERKNYLVFNCILGCIACSVSLIIAWQLKEAENLTEKIFYLSFLAVVICVSVLIFHFKEKIIEFVSASEIGFFAANKI